ncbi:MAG: uroporphyrinogen decarboxylase family protein [Planctomycetota bacterium]
MNSRERVKAAIGHKPVDRVAIDFAARDEVVKALKKHFSVTSHEALMRKLGVDLRGVRPECAKPNKGKGYSDPTVRIADGIYYDIWGIGFKESTTAGGSYMDLAFNPPAQAASVADIMAHLFPSADDYDYSKLKAIPAEWEDCWVFTHSRGMFENAWFMRGFDNFLVDLMVNEEMAAALLDRLQGFFIEKARRTLEAAGGRIDMIEYNDDIGGQTGILLNPDTWRKHIKPRMKTFIDMARGFNAKVRYHSCGGYTAIIPDLIDIGVDVLNPVQTVAKGMDAAFLAIEAFDAGLPVWLEKPPALRAAEIAEMIRHRGNRTAAVGFKKVFMPATIKAREILALPEFGPLKTILAVYPMSVPENGRMVLDQGTVTNWLGNGVHPLSLMLAVGGTVQTVTTHRGRNGGGAVVLAFADGCLGNLHMVEGNPGGQPMERYAFYGSGRSVEITNNSRVAYCRGIPFDYETAADFAPPGLDRGTVVWETQNTRGTLENKALFVQGMVGEMRHFCDAVFAGTPVTLGSLEFALHLMQVYEAGLLSDGHPVPVG